MAEVAHATRRGRARRAAGRARGPRSRGPGADRLHLGHHRRGARRAAAGSATSAARRSRPSTGSGREEGDLVWCTAASGWSKSARNAFLAPWLRGAAALLHDGRFDPAERLEIAEREGVTVLCQAPTEYRMLAKRTELRPVDGLRRMVSAGEALNPEVIDAFHEATGLWIGDGYGQTETGAVTGMRPGDEAAPRIDGPPAARARDAGRGRGASAQGTPPPRPSSAAISTASRSPSEWWPTGDLVETDDDGFLTHVGRADDLISSAGYRIGPVEVESALVSHPAVAEAAAVAAPDEERGSVVRAIVVLRDGEPGRRARRRAPGALQAGHGSLQVPADRRVRRRAAEDLVGEDQARGAARRREPDRAHTRAARGRPSRASSSSPTSGCSRSGRRCRCCPSTSPRSSTAPTSRSGSSAARLRSQGSSAVRSRATSPTRAGGGRRSCVGTLLAAVAGVLLFVPLGIAGLLALALLPRRR